MQIFTQSINCLYGQKCQNRHRPICIRWRRIPGFYYTRCSHLHLPPRDEKIEQPVLFMEHHESMSGADLRLQKVIRDKAKIDSEVTDLRSKLLAAADKLKELQKMPH